MKRWELATLLGLVLALVLTQFTAFAEACDAVCTDTLRLHIVANSDSEADQACKLMVRDAILAQYGAVLAQAGTKHQAIEAAQANLDGIAETAREAVKAQGLTASVRVRLAREHFDTRVYDGFTLPSGEYDALRVELGAAQGRNWFCVLYPALCLPAASDKDGMQTYSAQEREAVSTPYTVKFAIAEWLRGA